MTPAARYWSSVASAFLARMGLMRYGRSDGCTIRRNGNLERDEGAETKSVLDVEKTSGNSQRMSPKALMTAGDQPEPWRSNLMSRRCNGSRSQVWRKLSLWLSSKRSRSFGQGVVRGVEASVGEQPSMATGMLSCRVWTSCRWMLGGRVVNSGRWGRDERRR